MIAQRQPASTEGVDRAIARIASAQAGVFSWDQALRAGATPSMVQHRLRTGRWERMSVGIYRVAGAPHSWKQDLYAGFLACGAGAAVSHRAAAALLAMAGYDEGHLEFWIPAHRRVRRDGITAYRAVELARADVGRFEKLRVTTPARTLIDLAGLDPLERVEIALDDALARGRVTLGRLHRRLDVLARKGRAGIEAMRALLAERDPASPPAKSPLETRFRRFLKRIGAPDPVRQHPVTCNGKRYYLDFAYPHLLVAFELDGYAPHAGRAPFERDRARVSDLVAHGWRVLLVTSRQLDLHDELATRILALLPSDARTPGPRAMLPS